MIRRLVPLLLLLLFPSFAGAQSFGARVHGQYTIFDRPNANPVATQLVDSNGDPVSVGGGTQYNQGTVGTDTDSLTMAGCVRADTAAVATGVANGDRSRCIVDADGKIWVNVGTVAVTGPLTDAQLRATPVPVSGTVTVTDGAGALNVICDSGCGSGDGIIRDGAGDTTQANVSSGRLHVDGSGVTQPISGTVTVTDGAGPLNVIVDSSALPTGASTLAEQQTQTTALQLIDDTVATDGAATPTKGILIAGQDGTNAQTIKTDTSGELQVDVLTLPSVTIGTFPDNEPFNVAQINGVAPLMGAGNTGTGSPRVTIATDQPTLTNTFGNVGEVPITSGGLSISRTVSGASTNATSVKASAGQVYNIQVSSVNAAARYLHLYNTAGAPTCNASIISTHIVPGNTAGAGTNIVLAPGVAFGTGIGFCLTTAVDGTGSVSANEHVVMISYK